MFDRSRNEVMIKYLVPDKWLITNNCLIIMYDISFHPFSLDETNLSCSTYYSSVFVKHDSPPLNNFALNRPLLLKHQTIQEV